METIRSPILNDEDRLSKLPESLIHHILSFLDMKYVIHTSLLSRTWRHIWKSVPTLNFDSDIYDESGDEFNSFIHFIDRVFVFRDRTNVMMFDLVCADEIEGDLENSLLTWTLALVNCNVRELSVDIADVSMEVKVPTCLFTCKSLTKLEWRMGGTYYGDIELPNVMYLPRLQFLKLDGVNFNDDKLTDRNGARIVKLYAPNLVTFICKDFILKDYTLENLSSLLTADINMRLKVDKYCYGDKDEYEYDYDDDEESEDEDEDESEDEIEDEEEADEDEDEDEDENQDDQDEDEVYDDYYEDDWSEDEDEDGDGDEDEVEDIKYFTGLSAEKKEPYAKGMMSLLGALRNVIRLKLSSSFLEVLSEAPGLLDSHPHMSLNVQHLKLKTCLSRNCLHSITYLLRNSPLVQSLCIVLKRKAFGSESDREDWDAESSPSCELQNLKLVDIQCIQGQENELNFLKFLLKNGVVLEKVVLSSSASKEGKLVEINEKLVTFPRASLGVQVLPTNLSR
ncbi:FBD-associated F-box protein At5g22730-like isoform X1 [Papaver somniferum]|uniref:FBD-associated F-box protein At5g22730-like isoform X1 n=2 Tax=Papaver somniferum TaxID=3469 RepID=UPI000E6FC1EB|nr:FBD-associated F-box protein At5g22730-like isoform X1 [Papaver somniferum]